MVYCRKWCHIKSMSNEDIERVGQSLINMDLCLVDRRLVYNINYRTHLKKQGSPEVTVNSLEKGKEPESSTLRCKDEQQLRGCETQDGKDSCTHKSWSCSLCTIGGGVHGEMACSVWSQWGLSHAGFFILHSLLIKGKHWLHWQTANMPDCILFTCALSPFLTVLVCFMCDGDFLPDGDCLNLIPLCLLLFKSMLNLKCWESPMFYFNPSSCLSWTSALATRRGFSKREEDS